MHPIDPAFLRPFLAGTVEALLVTCNLEVKAGQPYMKGEAVQPEFQIAAILGITSSSFRGSITLLFNEPVYLKVIGGWLGENITTLTKEHQDGVAELLNIIYGSARVVWNEQGRKIQQAIPTVVTGKLQTNNKDPVLIIPFLTNHGEFHLEICSSKLSAEAA